MRVLDVIKQSQTNLLRAKLRTFLTIAAVFIGTFTISLTNGVGNGVKSYVNTQLGNIQIENVLIVQANQDGPEFVGTEVEEYDPNKTTGQFFNTLLTNQDLDYLRQINGVQSVTALQDPQVEYVYADNSKKYTVIFSQFIEGLNLDMASGRVLEVNKLEEATIPVKYLEPLGLGSAEESLGKKIKVGYKNLDGSIAETELTIVGVQQESLIGNSSISVSPLLSRKIQADRAAGTPMANAYQAAVVNFDANYSEEDIDRLKQLINANNYSAQTLADQVGQINTVINTILIVLNVFSAIALVAATFGIVNTLLMAVKERTSEIGLMKALGANSKTVFSIFALEAASIGFWGALLGILLSILVGTITSNIASNNFLKDFEGFRLLTFPILPTLGILFGIMLLAFLAGALPSLKASRLDPIKALRYE